MERKEGLEARVKKGVAVVSAKGTLRHGEILVLTQLTKKTGGVFFDAEARGYSNNWVWYVKKWGFNPRSGSWWSDHPNFRKKLDLAPANPFLALVSQQSNEE